MNNTMDNMINLEFLGIYPDSINTVIETCENVLRELGFSGIEIDDMNDAAKSDFEMIGSLSDITNSIIESYYSATAYMIKSRYPEKEVTYYVDGGLSDFCIDGEVQ